MTPRACAWIERVGQRQADAQHVAVAQLAVALEHRQRAAAHELGDQEALAALLAGVEHGHDARVVEPRGRQRLALCALGHRPGRRHGLDRHGPVESFVARREDRAEPTGAQPCARAGSDPARGRRQRRSEAPPWRPSGGPSTAAGRTLPAMPPGRLVLVGPRQRVDQARRDGRRARGDELPALSFFDEDDEPRRTTPRPRRARPAGGGVATDSQTLLIRRIVRRRSRVADHRSARLRRSTRAARARTRTRCATTTARSPRSARTRRSRSAPRSSSC